FYALRIRLTPRSPLFPYTTLFRSLFNGILNPKQLNGLRLLVSQFPQQQFNQTADRRSLKPSLGVSCFDCHANGHTNAGTHLVGEDRKSTRLNSSHVKISYAVFCLK